MPSQFAFMKPDARIYIAGHKGLVGSAIHRHLRASGYTNLLERSRQDLDLLDSEATASFFRREQPEFVFLAAAKVGGIMANQTHPASFIRDNLAIQSNIIESAYEAGVKRLLFLGSSCIYPKFASQPITEDSLLTGPLESTNRPYALAKIAGVEMCWGYNRQYGTRYLAAMPTNLYGPGDNFDLQTSHVLPAMIARFHTATETNAPNVTLWGTGTPRREFLHVDDVAVACEVLLDRYDDPAPINIGVGEDITIRELAMLVADVVGYQGELLFDQTKPDGTPRKLLDVHRIQALGFTARIGLRDGIASTYAWYLEYLENVRP
jgi:GDP-L-fucose synthase